MAWHGAESNRWRFGPTLNRRSGDDAGAYLRPDQPSLETLGNHRWLLRQAASLHAQPPRVLGIFELTRRRAEELRRGPMPGPPVRLRAPRGISHVQLFSGIHRAVAADGTVEMTESDAAPLLGA
jgi:hypothetical protein